jgi:hypothetical protein
VPETPADGHYQLPWQGTTLVASSILFAFVVILIEQICYAKSTPPSCGNLW